MTKKHLEQPISPSLIHEVRELLLLRRRHHEPGGVECVHGGGGPIGAVAAAAACIGRGRRHRVGRRQLHEQVGRVVLHGGARRRHAVAADKVTVTVGGPGAVVAFNGAFAVIPQWSQHTDEFMRLLSHVKK